MGDKKVKNGTYLYEILSTEVFKGLPNSSINRIMAYSLPNPVYGEKTPLQVFTVLQLLTLQAAYTLRLFSR